MKDASPLPINRRTFLSSTVAAGIGLTVLPGRARAAKGPGGKLNIALIGAHGRGSAHYGPLRRENVVALCDVKAENLALAAAEFPAARPYTDWRKCLEQKDLDAVVCCTPDHHHAFIAIWAMNRGLHVYCEKPLGDSVEEARAVRKVYLANRHRLATQHGTQRHAGENFDRVAEWVKGGAIGELQDVHAWGNRTHRQTAYRPASGSPPVSLDWDQWIGPVSMHPFNPAYVSGSPGANCLQWNMFHDFGSWQVGDMGSHVMDLAWNALDAGSPTTASASGDPVNPDVCPSALRAVFDLPANDWRKEIRVAWYQGGPLPNSPSPAIDLAKIGHGVMFKGSKGVIVCDFTQRMLLPQGRDADMTYYTTPAPGQVTPRRGGFVEEWLQACRGDLKTSCDFDYAGRMIEMLLLGLVAHQAGADLAYDANAGRITNHADANAFLAKTYRPGWTLNG